MIADKEAAVEAAQAAEQQVRKQLTSTSTSGEALKEAQAEADSLRQQLEESVRKYSTVKQARERAMTEASLCALVAADQQQLQDAMRSTFTLSIASCHADFWRIPTCLAGPQTPLDLASICVFVVTDSVCRTRQGVLNRHLIQSGVVQRYHRS